MPCPFLPTHGTDRRAWSPLNTKANIEEQESWPHLESRPDGGRCRVSCTRHHAITVARLDHHDPKCIGIPQGIPCLVWFQTFVLARLHQGIHILLQIWRGLHTMNHIKYCTQSSDLKGSNKNETLRVSIQEARLAQRQPSSDLLRLFMSHQFCNTSLG